VMWSTTGIWREAQSEYANFLAWSRSTPSGSWSPSRKLTSSLGEDGGQHLSLSMNGSGAALAAWTQVHRTGSPSRVWAARFRPDGTWGPSLEVAGGGGPTAFMDRRGKAHLIAGQNRRRIVAFNQSTGRPWGTGAIIATGHLYDVAGRGDSLIALYAASPGLLAGTWSSRR
jgi:hypothetical protein